MILSVDLEVGHVQFRGFLRLNSFFLVQYLKLIELLEVVLHFWAFLSRRGFIKDDLAVGFDFFRGIWAQNKLLGVYNILILLLLL